MNNEKASATVQCHFSRTSVSYTPTLLCNMGDIYQLYTGTHTASPVCVPQFTESSPAIVELWLNRSDGSVVSADDITGVDWYVGDVRLEFSSSTKKSTGSVFKDIFQRVDATATSKPGLRVINNLVGPLGGVSSVLRAEATVTDDHGNPMRQSASLPVTISQVTENSFSLSVKAVGGELAITENGQTLAVTASAYNGLEPLEFGTEWQLVWDVFADGAWKRRTESKTGQITVSEGEVQSNMLVRAALCKKSDVGAKYASAVIDNPDSANYVRPYAIDTAVIYDTSDPYVISPNPDPEDCTLTDTGATSKIVFSPVMSRRDGTPVSGTVRFTVNAMSLSGVVMKGPVTVNSGGTFELLKADFNQSSDINVTIDGEATVTA